MKIEELILASGHRNIMATHKTTVAFTKDCSISTAGDCILAVAANKALAELSSSFKACLRNERAKLTIKLEAAEATDVMIASGSPHLTLGNPVSMVIRKSGYLCDRTLAVKADKAACDLSRQLVKVLREPNRKVEITLTVEV